MAKVSFLFKQDFLASLPSMPGIYQIFDDQSNFIYVGKAKNLRRRLQQYKNAKRRRKHRKMRNIIAQAARIQFEVCQSELEAEILETQLIQTYRPRWNVSGAFYFLYPMIGMKHESNAIFFCYTTQPELFADFDLHGAFRSREITGEAFFALVKLLRYVGHALPRNKTTKSEIPKYSYLYGFRQIPEEWWSLWKDFWMGNSKRALEELTFHLVENAGARQRSREIQKLLNCLTRFSTHEACPLLKARQLTEYQAYPVSQKERDFVFLKYRRSHLAPRDSKGVMDPEG